MLRAVLFDMDGLLIDSEPLWVRAEIEVFATVGVNLCEADCATTKGLRVDDVVAHWYATRPWRDVSCDELQAALVARVAALIATEGRALAGVTHATDVARSDGRSLALASSSPRVVIDAVLHRLGLRDVFPVAMSAEDERYGKPHPAVFLSAAERLGVMPTECLVIEDSLTGVIAAKAARMACIAVPERDARHDPRFSLADRVVDSLEAITRELLHDVART